jgi:hypothetical protein
MNNNQSNSDNDSVINNEYEVVKFPPIGIKNLL